MPADSMPVVSIDADKLVKRRAKLRLTQEQVADLAGMSQQAYARVESGGRKDPRLSTAEKIAKALRTTVDALLVAAPRPARGDRKK